MDQRYPDHLYQLNRRKIQKDQTFILKEEMLKSTSELTHFTNLLGSWMVTTGEKLRKRSSFSAQVRKLDSFQDTSRIFKA